jgi:hypothetical protein
MLIFIIKYGDAINLYHEILLMVREYCLAIDSIGSLISAYALSGHQIF